MKKRVLTTISFVAVLASSGTLLLLHTKNGSKDGLSPIPKDISKSVSFPIYYPNPSQMPAGYKLDLKSFTKPANDVVLYSIDYGNEKLVFSVQKKPSDNDLRTFNSQRIPLHTTLNTKVGLATIGAIGNQSITSLPVDNSNAWIIVTAPYNTEQNKLAEVLNAIKADK